jgi:uncharacterized protein (DUF983 family)
MLKDKKPVEETATPVKPEVKKYRYSCPACTGVAFLSTNKMLNVKVTCEKCGKEFITCEANYILL